MSLQHCWSCVPQMLMCHTFIVILFNVLFHLVCSLIPLWLENRLCMIWIILNWLSFVLWPKIDFNLVNVSKVLENNVYSALIGYSVLKRSIRYSWLMVLLSSTSLLIFCLIVISIDKSRVLKSLIIIVDYLFLLSALSVFVSLILKLCCLMNTLLESLCLLGGLIFISFL